MKKRFSTIETFFALALAAGSGGWPAADRLQDHKTETSGRKMPRAIASARAPY
jgi:hypothetical protein